MLSTLGVSACQNLQSHLNPPPIGLYRCRLTYNENQIDVSYHPYSKRTVKSLKIIHDDAITYTQKSTDRTHIDKLFNLREECDDVLIVKNGFVTDTSIANIAFLKDGVWYTPSTPLLEGTTRERLLDDGFLTAQDIRVEDLESFSQVALLNAMIDFDIIADITYKI